MPDSRGSDERSVQREPDPAARQRRVAWALGAALALAAVAVFGVLPSVVARRAPDPVAESAGRQEPVLLAESQEPPDPALIAARRAAAERSLGEWLALREQLEDRGVESWAESRFAEAVERADRAAEQLGKLDFAAAARSYDEAIAVLRELENRALPLYRQSLARGDAALAAGRGEEARAHFALARLIEPTSEHALRGLERSGRIDRVFALQREAAEHEGRGDLDAAREALQQALALDGEVPSLGRALERVERARTDAAFREQMSRGFAALEARRFAAARRAFREARDLLPEAPEPADALAAVEDAAQLAALARHRRNARAFESSEQWEKAAEQYGAALSIEPTLAFAKRGLDRSRRRADLASKLDAYRAQPGRLAAREVFEDAERLLERARTIPEPGSRLTTQIATLARLLERAGTLHPVEILSDGLTSVRLRDVGHLGSFTSRRIELRPGTYTVVGSRDGYRDVWKQFTVTSDAPTAPVIVRCEESL